MTISLTSAIASLNNTNACLDIAYKQALATINAVRIAELAAKGISAYCYYDDGLVYEMTYSDFLRHEGEIGGECTCSECYSPEYGYQGVASSALEDNWDDGHWYDGCCPSCGIDYGSCRCNGGDEGWSRTAFMDKRCSHSRNGQRCGNIHGCDICYPF